MIAFIYVLIVLIFRYFLNGMYMFFLTKRQVHKRLKGMTLKESLTFSKCRDEIPNGWIRFYWFVIGFFPPIIIVVSIIRTVYGTDPFIEYVIQLFAHALVYIIGLVLLIFQIAFYGKDNDAYDRWILSPKERKRRMLEKKKKKTMRLQKKKRKR